MREGKKAKIPEGKKVLHIPSIQNIHLPSTQQGSKPPIITNQLCGNRNRTNYPRNRNPYISRGFAGGRVYLECTCEGDVEELGFHLPQIGGLRYCRPYFCLTSATLQDTKLPTSNNSSFLDDSSLLRTPTANSPTQTMCRSYLALGYSIYYSVTPLCAYPLCISLLLGWTVS